MLNLFPCLGQSEMFVYREKWLQKSLHQPFCADLELNSLFQHSRKHQGNGSKLAFLQNSARFFSLAEKWTQIYLGGLDRDPTHKTFFLVSRTENRVSSLRNARELVFKRVIEKKIDGHYLYVCVWCVFGAVFW
jgi:hypothetical protein